jgi:hypothetical protein
VRDPSGLFNKLQDLKRMNDRNKIGALKKREEILPGQDMRIRRNEQKNLRYGSESKFSVLYTILSFSLDLRRKGTTKD